MIDTHAHIYYKDYETDFEDMLQNAANCGVDKIIVVGTDIESSKKSVELSIKYQNIYAAVGIHPNDAVNFDENCIGELTSLFSLSDKVIAIGEIGLDFYRDKSPKDKQQEVFEKLLALAEKLQKPVIIHDRDAHDQILSTLKKFPAVKGVLHCFSGDINLAKEVILLGYYISVTGNITYRSNTLLQDVVKAISIDKILIETDSPYLSPIPYRGKRNEPAFVKEVALKIAEIKNLSFEDVDRITTKNASDLFGIDGFDQSSKIAYKIRNSLYLNITNRCSNRCTFCPKFEDFNVKGHNLYLQKEPNFEEIISAIGNRTDVDEIVFCGFGEPTLRIDILKDVASEMKKLGFKIRVNSDGQGNLFNKRNILPELVNIVDSFSISLNAADADEYSKLCNTPYGEAGYVAIKDFIKKAVDLGFDVTATAVTIPGVDIKKCIEVAESLGAKFRVREYEEVG